MHDESLILKSLSDPSRQQLRWGIGTAHQYVAGIAPCFNGEGSLCPVATLKTMTDTPRLLAEFQQKQLDRDFWTKYLDAARSRLTYCDKAMGDTDALVKSVREGADVGPFRLHYDSVLTSVNKDRDGDIVHPKGLSIDANMPDLWMHMQMQPIGAFIKLLHQQDDEPIRGRFGIADTSFGRDVAKLLMCGALRKSIGFRALEFQPIEIVRAQDGRNVAKGYEVTKGLVLESSLVTIPANADAIVYAYAEKELETDLVKHWAKGYYDQRPTQGIGLRFADAGVDVDIENNRFVIHKSQDMPITAKFPAWPNETNAQTGPDVVAPGPLPVTQTPGIGNGPTNAIPAGNMADTDGGRGVKVGTCPRCGGALDSTGTCQKCGYTAGVASGDTKPNYDHNTEGLSKPNYGNPPASPVGPPGTNLGPDVVTGGITGGAEGDQDRSMPRASGTNVWPPAANEQYFTWPDKALSGDITLKQSGVNDMASPADSPNAGGDTAPAQAEAAQGKKKRGDKPKSSGTDPNSSGMAGEKPHDDETGTADDYASGKSAELLDLITKAHAALRDMQKGASTPRAIKFSGAEVGEDTAWDAAAAVKRGREWAGVDEDDAPASAFKKYAKIFALQDGPSDDLTSYKLPYHDIDGDKLVISPKGTAAALAALNGARGGGMNLDAAVKTKVHDVLAKAHKKAYPDKEVPELMEKAIAVSLLTTNLAKSLGVTHYTCKLLSMDTGYLEGSFEWITAQLQGSACAYLKSSGEKVAQDGYCYMLATYPDHAIVCCGGYGLGKQCYRLGWEMKDGDPRWSGDPVEVEIKPQVLEKMLATVPQQPESPAALARKLAAACMTCKSFDEAAAAVKIVRSTAATLESQADLRDLTELHAAN